MASMRGFVSGRVQGVGFRYFVRRAAEAEDLAGYAVNLADGRVEFLLQGDDKAVQRVIGLIRQGPPHAEVERLDLQAADEAERMVDFRTG